MTSLHLKDKEVVSNLSFQYGDASEDSGGEEPNMDVSRSLRLQRRNSTHTGEDPHLTECDLWENDAIAHTACREGYIMSPEVGGYGAYDVGGNLEGRLGHRRRVTVDGSLLVNIR